VNASRKNLKVFLVLIFASDHKLICALFKKIVLYFCPLLLITGSISVLLSIFVVICCITAILSFSHYCIGHIFLHYRLILCEAVFGLLLCGLGATA